MRRAALLLALAALAAPGCYSYGFRGQWRQTLGLPSPEENIRLMSEGADARDRREAMIRFVRHAPRLEADSEILRRGRLEIASRTSEAREREPHVRAFAAALLRQVGTVDEAGFLARSLAGDPQQGWRPEPEAYVRREMVKTLGLVGSQREVPLLAQVLANTREAGDTRVEAANALARIGGTEAVDGLVQGLRDRDESVVFASWDGLRRLTGEDLPPAETDWRRWWEEHRESIPEEDLAGVRRL